MKFNLKEYLGTEEFKLYSKIDDVIKYLKSNSIKYTQETWGNDVDMITNIFTVLSLTNGIKLFFASNNKMFKILVSNNTEYSLSNGIRNGMFIKEAKEIDKTIIYDEFEEIYESENGYWLATNPNDDTITSIQVFIKEVNNPDFDDCEW